jgi:WD40 repeat protein
MLPALRGHDDIIESVAFSPDGSKIVSGSQDKTIRVWDAGTGVELPGAQTVVDAISRSTMDDPTISLKRE